ncbi:major facilitator superfamily [Halteromyces radiatus]|uniref:major facilitator superfamily n=1 Tax=Halteromyces radiatus TaxID=101107 RepID=UPI0022204A12|nr:major facilitator superfamily [Halteromyces radiatus]KAI8090050.1 major facilitator superfamily [Halteromyces radiatus]
MLSYTALQPLYGRLSDAFGRRTIYQFSVIVFTFGSLFCGMATNLWTLVAARTVAGIGGGGLNIMSSVVTSDLVPLRERGKYQGYANLWFGTGALLGAPLGGWLTDTVGWRVCFYLNLPPLLISLYVGTFKLTNYNIKEQEMEGTTTTTMDRVKKIDYAGAVLLVASILAFMVATSLGGNSRPWTDPLVVALLVVFVVLILFFIVVEKNYAELPLVPWYVITARTPLACSVSIFCSIISSFSSTFLVPLFFQALLGYSPSESGIMFLPKVISGSMGSLYAGMHMSRTGEYRKYMIVNAGLQFVSSVCYWCWNAGTPTYLMYPVLFIDGFSIGSNITACLIALLSCVEAKDIATITSISYLFRTTGSVIGVCASQAIFQGVVKNILTKEITGPDAEEIIDIARKSMMQIRQLLPSSVLGIVLKSYEQAIQYAFFFCAVFAFIGFVCTFFVQQHSLKK